MCLHLIFHVIFRLEPYTSSSIPDRVVHPIPHDELVDGLEYKVETVLIPKLCNKNCIIWLIS